MDVSVVSGDADDDAIPIAGAPIAILLASSDKQKETDSSFEDAPRIGDAGGEAAIARAAGWPSEAIRQYQLIRLITCYWGSLSSVVERLNGFCNHSLQITCRRVLSCQLYGNIRAYKLHPPRD